MAVQRLFKDAQVTIGPWIDRGFYYDFDLATPLTDKDLKKIRKEMQKIIKMNLPFRREEVGVWVTWSGRKGGVMLTSAAAAAAAVPLEEQWL
jgi:threonyl-tRNA synthetase